MYLTVIEKCYWWNQQKLISPKLIIQGWSILFRFLESVNRPFSALKNVFDRTLTQIWVGFLGVCFEEKGEGELPPLKLVRIMAETWHLVGKLYTYAVSENIPFSTKDLLILVISTFYFSFCKISVILGKK